ncbi:hypothetical protein TPHA_0E01360 [Tetrapisispora phaffii CBS 4417]|uniref:Brl1/Brr6 domain-containing protein n=1 Tax=Tetrapisispora phaffii (strain ATCC 24235 / CBS 4417 / NBRC 1672 / NRRL Y-8282 / UCD 70-5) TaxID=1071381 RepID=G8BTK3_TETPH|nr:hypothetical protein TPHA_0E01360 [Tetrapisispora phaffii CBS 4417]CCE63231.1 hypothetical protein TPHA_0E01360 [Tetrapisispora phaffii CBS 4417]
MDLFSQLSLQDQNVGTNDEALLDLSKLSLVEKTEDISAMDIDAMSVNDIESTNTLKSVSSIPVDEILSVKSFNGGENMVVSDEENQNNNDNTNFIKSLLSPTSLGIAAATSMSTGGEYVNNENPEQIYTIEEPVDEKNEATTSTYLQDLQTELRKRSGKEPINIMINYHNYYNDGYTDNTNKNNQRVLSMHDQYYNTVHSNNVKQPQKDLVLRLPSPWSIYSHPVSRVSYNIMTILQLIINFITYMALALLLFLTLHTIGKDIKSIWNIKKIELVKESFSCRHNFTINRCQDNNKRLPALYEECEKWFHCMNRDNDMLFSTRTTLTMSFLGEAINAFIEPIGWKAIMIIILSFLTWTFATNFLFGFARAKSYYGLNKQSQQPTGDKQREPLANNSHSDSQMTKHPNETALSKISYS